MSRQQFINTITSGRKLNTKAYNKYRVAAKNGDREAQRRILQSHGYKLSIMDMPHYINLFARAGIMIEGVEYEQQPQEQHTNFVEDPTEKLKDQMQNSDKGTIIIA